jgi:hypothetical protein
MMTAKIWQFKLAASWRHAYWPAGIAAETALLL